MKSWLTKIKGKAICQMPKQTLTLLRHLKAQVDTGQLLRILKYYHVCYKVFAFDWVSWYMLLSMYFFFPALSSIHVLLWKLLDFFSPSSIYVLFCMTYIYYSRLCQKKMFFISSNMPLWFGFITWSLCLYQPQIPVDHKDRPYNKSLMMNTGKKKKRHFI